MVTSTDQIFVCLSFLCDLLSLEWLPEGIRVQTLQMLFSHFLNHNLFMLIHDNIALFLLREFGKIVILIHFCIDSERGWAIVKARMVVPSYLLLFVHFIWHGRHRRVGDLPLLYAIVKWVVIVLLGLMRLPQSLLSDLIILRISVELIAEMLLSWPLKANMFLRQRFKLLRPLPKVYRFAQMLLFQKMRLHFAILLSRRLRLKFLYFPLSAQNDLRCFYWLVLWVLAIQLNIRQQSRLRWFDLRRTLDWIVDERVEEAPLAGRLFNVILAGRFIKTWLAISLLHFLTHLLRRLTIHSCVFPSI